MFRSSDPKSMAAEVDAAYDNRIDVMTTYGSDSPEGVVAEVTADDMADAFRAQTGQDWTEFVR